MPKLPQVLQNMRRTWFTMKLRNSREGDIIADYCGPWSTQLSPGERLRTAIVPKIVTVVIINLTTFGAEVLKWVGSCLFVFIALAR